MSAASGAATLKGPGADRLGVGLALFALYAIWGSTYLGIRVALEGFPPLLMAAGRFVLAGGALYLFLRARGAPAPTGRQWLASAGVGAFLLVGGNGGVVLAEQSVDSGLASLLVATMPLWAALFGGLWGRWPGRLEWVGLGLGLAGVAVINLDSGLRASPLGALALLLAPLCWAFGSTWSRHLSLPAGLMASAAQMLTGGALLLGLSLVFGERLAGPPGPRPLLAFVYLTVFGSLVAYSAYAYLLDRVRPTLATSYAYVNPLVALGLGAWLAGEHVGPAAFAALPLVLTGVALVVLGKGRGAEGTGAKA